MVSKDDKTKLPDVSVIIVSWNAKSFLEQCLASLSTEIDLPYEVIVVDNNSSDGSQVMVARKFPWVNLIELGSNLGFAKGNNIGIQRSRGRYIALVNSDVKVFSSCIEKLTFFLDSNPKVGMVGPRIFYGDGRQQSSCRKFPSLWNNACEVFGLNKLFPKTEFFAGEHMFYFGYDRPCEVDVLVGCFMFVRRSAIDNFGKMDEEFFMYCEDVDWSLRCWHAGWKIMFIPDAKAVHYCGGSSKNEPHRFAVDQTNSRIRLWRKHMNPLTVLGFISLAIIGHTIRTFFLLLRRFLKKLERDSLAEIIKTHIDCIYILLGAATSLDLSCKIGMADSPHIKTNKKNQSEKPIKKN